MRFSITLKPLTVELVMEPWAVGLVIIGLSVAVCAWVVAA